MSYTFEPGKRYRMPTHFGPSLGPRQGPDGRIFECRQGPQTTSYFVHFLSKSEQLEKMLPPGFELTGEPVVSIELTYMKGIEWLAGRGYNVLGLTFPTVFNGEQDHVTGDFLTVLWENMADPILIGREELGFAKIYCELPDPMMVDAQTHCIASWYGFKFLDMRFKNMKQVAPDKPNPCATQGSEGLLHYKYVPRTGTEGEADVSHAVLTPAEMPNKVVNEKWECDATVQFHQAEWRDLPTTYHIVNAFAGLPIVEYRGASLVKSTGSKDVSDQRILT